MNTGLVLLAAGSSNRMGQPKQLLPFNGRPLIRHVLSVAHASLCDDVVVVLGKFSDQIVPLIDTTKAIVVHNHHWEEGMASSIRCGLEALLKKRPAAGAAIFMVCDQPFVSSTLLNELIRTKAETAKTIIASTYQGAIGTPALFDKIFFERLMQLHGQEGAKKIIMQHIHDVKTIPFPMGYIDIDTPGDYEELKRLTD